MKNSMHLKGFTLVELIVVIAIIGVLTGILIPSLIGYVQKAGRAADRATAKTIFNDVTMILAMSDDEFQGLKDNSEMQIKESAFSSFYRYNTAKTKAKICDADGKVLEEYDFMVVTNMDGNTQSGVGMRYYWQGGNKEARAFENALLYIEDLGKSNKIQVKMHTKIYKGKKTRRWIIGYRIDDPDKIEIWSADATSSHYANLSYRLYPPCPEFSS